MYKKHVDINDKFAVVTVFRENFLNREYEFNSPACAVYNDKYFKVRQKVFSFLYRNNFFNPKHSYVYLVDEDDFMCTKVVVNMSQMFREMVFFMHCLKDRLKMTIIKYLKISLNNMLHTQSV